MSAQQRRRASELVGSGERRLPRCPDAQRGGKALRLVFQKPPLIDQQVSKAACCQPELLKL